jgi:hypothetical protein
LGDRSLWADLKSDIGTATLSMEGY